MATGLKIPVGVNKSGGAAIEKNGAEQKKKLLTLALSEGGDDNAFQNLGLNPNLIFSIKDAAFRGKAKREVQRIFGQFLGLLELAPSTPITFDEDTLGEVALIVSYVDLETNKVETFRRSFAKG